jgi:serine/threonine-protein kinase
MRLTGKQLQQIQEALLDAYGSVDELRMLVRLELDENLNVIAGGDNLRVVTFNLLAWAEQHERLPGLIIGACNQRPGNAALVKLQAETRHWFPLKTPPLDIEWITIPAGTFLMGSDKSKDCMAYDDEMPQHSVHLPEYHIARYPITNAQYLAFVRAAGHPAPEYWANGEPPPSQADHPVVNVIWHDAHAYCAWASRVSGCSIRLPSEAEWEKAARRADGRTWPWGDDLPDASRCNFNRNVGGTTPVGSYPRGASLYEVLDMAGNVWEWTSSRWAEYPYAASDGREAMDGKDDDSGRVLRGGSYYNQAEFVRCAFRDWYVPNSWDVGIGFRVAASPPTSDL